MRAYRPPDPGLRGRYRPTGLPALAATTVIVLFALTGDPARASEPLPLPGTEITESRTGPGPILTKRTVAAFRYRAEGDASRFECWLDGGPWRGCRRGFFRRLVGPGSHVFRVRSVDPSGAVDPTPAIRRWRVDRWEPDLASASRFAARRAGRVAFSLDLGWRTWGRAARSRARMASTVKVMLMVAYLRMRSVRDRPLDGAERSLISAMIRVSDNNAANWVSFRVGPRAMAALGRRAGMKDFTYSPAWGTSTSSPADQALFMRRIETLLPDRHRGFALGLLSRISPPQRWGVARVRPPGWRLFFKGGWGISDAQFGGTVDHQISLLRRGRYRIGLAIFTEGDPYPGYGQGTLEGVARRLLRGLPTP